MADYIVTTRNKNGSLEERVYTANDRAELFKKLAADGVSAIRVREGAIGKKPKRKNAGSSASSKGRGLIVATLLVLVGGVAAWWMMKGGEKKVTETKVEKKETKIAPANPEKVKSSSPAVKEAKSNDPKELPPQKVGETRNGFIKLPSGRLHKVKGVFTNRTASVKGPYAIFKNRCDNEIAGLLYAKPGSVVGPMPKYSGRFTQRFLDSLKTPIVVTSEDSPEDAELKKAVIEAKKELKAAYDRGEDIEQIMLDSRKELHKLALYKRDIQQEIAKFRREGNASDQELEEFVQMANTMLEAKGIAPLNVGPITRQKIKALSKPQSNEEKK